MWKIIVAPILGLVIGYVTNDLAIRMLFHPYKPIHIGRWRLPFTPGLIPSQKERVAKSLGQVISSQLLSADTLQKEALSEETLALIRDRIEEGLRQLASNGRTLRECLTDYVPGEAVDDYALRARAACTDYLMKRIREADLGDQIARSAAGHIHARMAQMPMAGLLSDVLISSVTPTVTNVVNQLIEDKGPAMISEQIGQLERSALDKPISEILSPHQDRIPEAADRMLGLYRHVLEEKLAEMIAAVKIDQIIERKIATFEPADLERMIFGIMKKELRAIVYLGAALGFLMGFVNLLF